MRRASGLLPAAVFLLACAAFLPALRNGFVNWDDDQYLLNILYDPRIRAGITKEQVKELLPQLLPDVRAWVAKVNGLKE